MTEGTTEIFSAAVLSADAEAHPEKVNIMMMQARTIKEDVESRRDASTLKKSREWIPRMVLTISGAAPSWQFGRRTALGKGTQPVPASSGDYLERVTKPLRDFT